MEARSAYGLADELSIPRPLDRQTCDRSRTDRADDEIGPATRVRRCRVRFGKVHSSLRYRSDLLVLIVWGRGC